MADYKVTIDGCDPIMVRAANQAQARNHAVRQKVKIEILTTEDAIALAKDGKELEIAGDEQPEQPLPETEKEEGKE
jgi:hypothetical protein